MIRGNSCAKEPVSAVNVAKWRYSGNHETVQETRRVFLVSDCFGDEDGVICTDVSGKTRKNKE